MREIKFRAWAYPNKTMYENVRVGGGIESTVPSWLGPSGWVDLWEQNSDGVVMQYTGLKDKNGKEIYEGDVLRAERKGVRKEDNSRAIRQVEWINGLACFAFANRPLDNFQREFYGANISVEIIGNIYEHPELLTK